MPSVLPVVPGLWQVELGLVNAYLLDAGDGLVLVDTGYPGREGAILEAVREIGRAPQDVRAVVVTHHHPDHAGSLAAVLAATGADAWMHPADAAETRAGHAFRPYRTSSGLLNWVLERAVIRPAPDRYDPSPVRHEIGDGDEAPGGLRVLHTPGHTAGHLSLLWPRHGGVLIAGDACTHLPVLTWSIVYEDLETGRASLRRLAEQPFETAVFGHGKPLVGGARAAFESAFGGADAP